MSKQEKVHCLSLLPAIRNRMKSLFISDGFIIELTLSGRQNYIYQSIYHASSLPVQVLSSSTLWVSQTLAESLDRFRVANFALQTSHCLISGKSKACKARTLAEFLFLQSFPSSTFFFGEPNRVKLHLQSSPSFGKAIDGNRKVRIAHYQLTSNGALFCI